jgi:hypothetical protein
MVEINDLHNINRIVSTSVVKLGQYYENYYDFNMSVIDSNEGLKIAFRSSSDILNKVSPGVYNFISIGKIVKNNICSVKKIKFKGYGEHIYNRFNSMEDPRMFIWNKNTWILFVRPTLKYEKTKMVLLNIDTKEYIFFEDPLNRQHTKNWMPFVDSENNLYLLTDVDPLRVFIVRKDKLNEIFISVDKKNLNMSGSSNILEFYGKKIGVVHGKIFINDYPHYWHSVASWDNDWSNMKIGKFFFFEKLGIEFCTSILEKDNKIFISYSVDDQGMNLLKINKEDFRMLL